MDMDLTCTGTSSAPSGRSTCACSRAICSTTSSQTSINTSHVWNSLDFPLCGGAMWNTKSASGEVFCVQRRTAHPLVKLGIAPQSIMVVAYIPWQVAVEIGRTNSRIAWGKWPSSKLLSTTEMAFFITASISAGEISSAVLLDMARGPWTGDAKEVGKLVVPCIAKGKCICEWLKYTGQLWPP